MDDCLLAEMTAGTSGHRERAPSRRRRWGDARIVALALVAFVGLVILLYTASVHAAAPNSDGATVVLEGRAMTAGHLTLSGWRLSFDSFWSVDALVYAGAVAVVGVRPALMHLVPAVIAAAVIVLAARLAWETRRGIAGIAGALTVIGLLALPSHAFAQFLLLGPLHVGTTLWCLVAFACLRRAPAGWLAPVATLVLAAGLLGDLQTLAYGVAPVFGAGVVAMLRCRSWRAGVGAVGVAVASVVLAVVVRAAALLVGTFRVSMSHHASIAQAHHNVRLIPGDVSRLIGLGSGRFGRGGAPVSLDAAHGVALVVLVVGLVVALGRLVVGSISGGDRNEGITGRDRNGRVTGRDRNETSTGAWRLDDLLVLGVLGDLGVFVLLTLDSGDVAFARYFTPGIIFASLLAGRMIARLLAVPMGTLIPKALTVAGGATLAGLAASVGFTLATPAPTLTQQAVGRFLVAHHLRSGVADYWDSSIVTVATADRVAVRPVQAAPDGRLVAFGRQADTDWYGADTFRFVLFNPAAPYAGVDRSASERSYGPPEHVYRVAGDIVEVWRNPFVVASGS